MHNREEQACLLFSKIRSNRQIRPVTFSGGIIKHKMYFRRYVPQKPLSSFIEDFWLYENYTTDLHAKERILPTGTIEMVFNLQDDELRIYDPIHLDGYRRYSGALLCGPYQRCFVTDTAEETSVMGVHFKAAGACPFFRVSSEELADVHLDLELLWGPLSRTLRERLCGAGSATQKFHILEQALLAHLLRPWQHHYAVSAALCRFRQRRPHPMVREIAREIGLSQRRLIRVFSAEVGLTPKLFGRILRFQQAAALATTTTTPDWTQICLDCGYYDQSHLIGDFVEFSGLTPAEYAQQLRYLDQHGFRRKRNHVPLVQAA